MTLYLYAIAPASLPLLRVKGFDGHAVRRVRQDGLLAMVSEVAAAPVLAEEALRTHQAVLDALFAQATILPIRFGTLLAGEGEARRLLRQNESLYAKALAALTGKAEICVRVIWPEHAPEMPPRVPGPGGLFLAGRLKSLATLRAYEARAGKARDEVHRFLLGRALAGLVRTGRRNLLMTGDYLVPTGKPESFIRLCQQARERWPDYSFMVTGPWPPAAFAASLTGGLQDGGPGDPGGRSGGIRASHGEWPR